MVTEAEREAKRKHTELCSVEQLEQAIATVKEEPVPDGSTAVNHSAASTGTSVEPSEDSSISSRMGTGFDSLDESVRVLALSFGAYDDGEDLVHGAFRTVLRRRLELVTGQATSGTPIQVPNLDQWMMSLLQKTDLPTVYHSQMCSALRKAEIDHVMNPWLLRHDTNEVLATLELLEGLQVLAHGEHALVLLESIHVLRASQQRLDTAIRRNPHAIVTPASTISPTVRNVRSESTTLHVTQAGATKQRKRGKNAQRANSNQRTSPARRSQTAYSASRCMSFPTFTRESPSHEHQEDQFRTIPSSSPARAKGREAHEPTRHSAVVSAPSSAFDWRVSKPGASLSSTVLRYVKPDKSTLVLFFIGTAMKNVRLADISLGCREAFRDCCVSIYRWSETIWVAHVRNVPDVYTNVVNVTGEQLTAANTNSDPSSHFVACINGLEVANEQLKPSIEETIADRRGGGPAGRMTLYRATRPAKNEDIVFLRLYRAPPEPIFTVRIANSSGEPRAFYFKPSIMDYQEKCFYCGEMHEEMICPDAVQISSFSVGGNQ